MNSMEAKERPKKKHYYIMLNGKYVGQTWAVSSKKARANFWWKHVKGEDEMAPREYEPDDFDVIEA